MPLLYLNSAKKVGHVEIGVLYLNLRPGTVMLVIGLISALIKITLAHGGYSLEVLEQKAVGDIIFKYPSTVLGI